MPQAQRGAAFNLSAKVPIGGTLIALMLPSVFVTLLVVPAGYGFGFGSAGGMVKVVRAGETVNFYWMAITYLPIMVTLAFATSLVWAGRVVVGVYQLETEGISKREEWHKVLFDGFDVEGLGWIDASDIRQIMIELGWKDTTEADASKMVAVIDLDKDTRIDLDEFGIMLNLMGIHEVTPMPETPPRSPPRASKAAAADEEESTPLRASYVAKRPEEKVTLHSHIKQQQVVQRWVKSISAAKKDNRDEKLLVALDSVRKVSALEKAQWTLCYAYIVLLIAVGNTSNPDNPLWDAEMMPLAASCLVASARCRATHAHRAQQIRVRAVRRTPLRSLRCAFTLRVLQPRSSFAS